MTTNTLEICLKIIYVNGKLIPYQLTLRNPWEKAQWHRLLCKPNINSSKAFQRHQQHSHSNQLHVPQHSLETYGCWAFSAASQNAWNSPPDHAHKLNFNEGVSTHSLTMFLSKLITFRGGVPTGWCAIQTNTWTVTADLLYCRLWMSMPLANKAS